MRCALSERCNTYVYECCSNDNPGTEVFCYKEGPFRHADPSMSGSIDGKGSSCPDQ